MPSVFVTVITSGMATLYRLSFDVCIESPRRFTSVYLASTVAVSPFFSFSPAPLRTICMYTHDGSGRKAILTGWLASQSDMLSEDWEIVGQA